MDAVAWHAGQIVSTKASGPACLIQSSYGKDVGAANGNFEVLAVEGTSLVHYTHSNSNHVQWAGLYQPNAYAPTSNGGIGTGYPGDPYVGGIQAPYPVEDVDFTADGAYSVYNWELFFHAPMLIATTLSQNQQFAAADTWFRFIFDPTNDSPNELAPQRYWNVLPFKTTPAESITDLMTALDHGDASAAAQVHDWRAHPFAPFRIARLRVTAFQRWVVMKYLDNLIAWGDQLFAQNTAESINQATQLYVLASDLLGPRPELVPARTVVPAQTYSQLQPRLDAFSNVMEWLENEFPFATQVPPPGPNADTAGLLGLSQTLFFGIPQNATMLGYWDTVADRLFKIRNCMNLQGVVGPLPLFQPIANPALLVQAAAEGVDLGSVLNDLSAPPPNYRFSYLLGKAIELCADCRAFGGALLTALEKGDAEGLALLHATQETQVLNAMEITKQDHITELTDAVNSLQASRDIAWGRYTYYQMLLGATPGAVPAIGTAIPGYPVPTQKTTTDGGIQLLQEEEDELTHSHTALNAQLLAISYEMMASLCHYIPQGSIDAEPFGIGGSIEFGGEHIGPALAAIGRWFGLTSTIETYAASHAGKMAGYFRRWQEWALQSNLASGEIMRIDNDIAAANLRVTIAQEELAVHQKQMANAQKVQDTLSSKYTSQQLYLWMADQASGLYFQLYQMAYSAAKQAERAFDTELGLAISNYIQFGYWDSLRKGLMAGERLQAGLRQLEQAYISQNKREYEITRNVSLLLHDPVALITLKEAGQCIVEFPEALFDMDYPGQYLRRLESVSLTVPCVAGPYTSVNCTLTLLAHKIRTNSDLPGGVLLREPEQRPALPVHVRSHPVHRHQPRPERQRHVRAQLPRRAVPAVRNRRSDLTLADQHAAAMQRVRLRHHHRRHLPAELHRPRRRRPAAQEGLHRRRPPARAAAVRAQPDRHPARAARPRPPVQRQARIPHRLVRAATPSRQLGGLWTDAAAADHGPVPVPVPGPDGNPRRHRPLPHLQGSQPTRRHLVRPLPHRPGRPATASRHHPGRSHPGPAGRQGHPQPRPALGRRAARNQALLRRKHRGPELLVALREHDQHRSDRGPDRRHNRHLPLLRHVAPAANSTVTCASALDPAVTEDYQCQSGKLTICSPNLACASLHRGIGVVATDLGHHPREPTPIGIYRIEDIDGPQPNASFAVVEQPVEAPQSVPDLLPAGLTQLFVASCILRLIRDSECDLDQ